MKKQLFFVSAILLLFSCLEKEEKIRVSKALTKEEILDSTKIKSLFNTALTQGESYEWLRDLTQNIGGRLSGSPEAAKAVLKTFDSLNRSNKKKTQDNMNKDTKSFMKVLDFAFNN